MPCTYIGPFNRLTCLPTYSITAVVTSVNEGGSVTFTVNTVNVPSGSTLLWQLKSVDGSPAPSEADVDPAGSTFGRPTFGTLGTYFTVWNSPTPPATFTIKFKEDLTTEGIEKFYCVIKTFGCNVMYDPVVATSQVISVMDTSVDPEVPPGGSGGYGPSARIYDVRWNPQGTMVAFAYSPDTGDDTHPSIMVKDASGGTIAELEPSDIAYTCDWNSNGTLLVGKTLGQMFAYSVSGTTFTKITPSYGLATSTNQVRHRPGTNQFMWGNELIEWDGSTFNRVAWLTPNWGLDGGFSCCSWKNGSTIAISLEGGADAEDNAPRIEIHSFDGTNFNYVATISDYPKNTEGLYLSVNEVCWSQSGSELSAAFIYHGAFGASWVAGTTYNGTTFAKTASYSFPSAAWGDEGIWVDFGTVTYTQSGLPVFGNLAGGYHPSLYRGTTVASNTRMVPQSMHGQPNGTLIAVGDNFEGIHFRILSA